jgi:hypothetical protein
VTEAVPSRIRSWLINVALVAISLVVALVLGELALRMIGFSNPVLWTYDDVTGSKLRAGAEGWFRAEGEAYIKINGAGLRDREHGERKPPNTVRIAVLGDSMSEAFQVPLEGTFGAVLERQLRNCGSLAGKDIEVINFGVSGYGTAQELLTFRHRAAAYSPDVTVLGFYAGNDVRNNSKELEPNKLRPFFLLRDGVLVADNSFLNDDAYVSYKSTFIDRSKYFDLRMFQFMRQLKSVIEQWSETRAASGRDANLEVGLDDNAFLPPPTKDWSDAWELTERLIVATRDAVEAGGGRFVVVSIPIGIQAHPDPMVRNQFMHRLHIDDLWYTDRRMGEFAAREGVDVITLGQPFQSYAEKNRVYLYGFENTGLGSGHLNVNGHRLMGETLARHLCQPQ